MSWCYKNINILVCAWMASEMIVSDVLYTLNFLVDKILFFIDYVFFIFTE